MICLNFASFKTLTEGKKKNIVQYNGPLTQQASTYFKRYTPTL